MNTVKGFLYKPEDMVVSLLGLSTFKTMGAGNDTTSDPCFVNCSLGPDCFNGTCICPVSLSDILHVSGVHIL